MGGVCFPRRKTNISFRPSAAHELSEQHSLIRPVGVSKWSGHHDLPLLCTGTQTDKQDMLWRLGISFLLGIAQKSCCWPGAYHSSSLGLHKPRTCALQGLVQALLQCIGLPNSFTCCLGILFEVLQVPRGTELVLLNSDLTPVSFQLPAFLTFCYWPDRKHHF